MKIIVTGALGHIGSKLIRELPARFPGAEIIMVDMDANRLEIAKAFGATKLVGAWRLSRTRSRVSTTPKLSRK